MNQIWVIVLTLLWMVALWECVGNEFKHIEKFFRWLKGSRTSYYLSTTPGYEEVYTTHPLWKLRTEIQRMSFYKRKMGSIIEISHGLFRRRSAIYGEASKNWRIISDRAWPNTLRWVYFKDRRGLRIEDALPLINTYPSLQAMLDRIAQQDKEYKVLVEGVVALRARIIVDRQRFRSPAVQQIREYLEMILKEVKKEDFECANPEAWERRFMGQRPENAPVR